MAADAVTTGPARLERHPKVRPWFDFSQTELAGKSQDGPWAAGKFRVRIDQGLDLGEVAEIGDDGPAKSRSQPRRRFK